MGKMGLRIAAVRDGFKSELKGNRKKSFLLDLTKFKKWIENTIDVIPEGFVLVGKSARELNITNAYAYILIKKHKIKTIKAGAGKSKIYVDFAILKQYIKGNVK